VTELLVVAGEASGDRAGARVVAELGPDVRVFGLGGRALEDQGAELLARVPDLAVAGLDFAGHAIGIARAFVRVLRAARARKPRAALLVDYVEFNARLAPRLRREGIKVLWYGAPQVWAWRPERIDHLKDVADAIALVLPFEESLWRAKGAPARYVGHPVLELHALSRSQARSAMSLTDTAAAVALLPGSRAQEVRRLLPAMLAAYEIVRADRASVDGRLLLAPGLDEATRAFAVAEAQKWRVPYVEVDPSTGAYPILSAFDGSLCAAGTASLEAALAGAMPVITYKVSTLTAAFVRPRLVTPHVALPNVLLGRRVFPELLQDEADPRSLARALGSVLDRRSELEVARRELEALLRPPGATLRPSVAVAETLRGWL
jgi:lipid-A-disaccharide synthase